MRTLAQVNTRVLLLSSSFPPLLFPVLFYFHTFSLTAAHCFPCMSFFPSLSLCFPCAVASCIFLFVSSFLILSFYLLLFSPLLFQCSVVFSAFLSFLSLLGTSFPSPFHLFSLFLYAVHSFNTSPLPTPTAFSLVFIQNSPFYFPLLYILPTPMNLSAFSPFPSMHTPLSVLSHVLISRL